MYLISQTFIYLALALIIGGAIGYAFRSCLADTACDDVRDDLKFVQSRYDALETSHSATQALEATVTIPVPAALSVEPDNALSSLSSRDLEAALLDAAPGTSFKARFGRDDLTQIAGINTKTEAWLGLNGITRFAHIANLTAAELYWLIETLPQNGASVYRDQWVAQAAALERNKVARR